MPFDSYGVGTKMGMSADAPWTDMSYKLVQYQDRPVLKLSTDKASWPGRKQVFRYRASDGKCSRDLISAREEDLPGERILKEYMRDGRLIDRYPSLLESRSVFATDFAALPTDVKAIENPALFPVEFSAKLTSLRNRTTQKLQRN